MPINVVSSFDETPTTNGRLLSSIGDFTCDFSGSHGVSPDYDGALSRSLDPFVASFIDSDTYPKLGAIIYDREWAEDSANGVNWRNEMAKLDVVVVGLFPRGTWDSASPSGLSREEAYNDLIARSRSWGPGIYIFDYTSPHEASTIQSVEDDIVDWVDNTTAFSGGVPGDWSANNFWARDSGGNRINTFKAVPEVLNINIVDPGAGGPDLTDAGGRQYPQWYGDRILQYMFDSVNTNKQGVPGSVGWFQDVMDPRTKTSNYDHNASGSSPEDPQGDWNNPAEPASRAVAAGWRQGHRNYGERLRAKYSTMAGFGNWTLCNNGAFMDGGGDPIERYSDDDMSVFPHVIPEYFQWMNGGYIENNTKGDFPESGVKADGTIGGGAPGTYNSQLVYNRYVQVMLSTAPPRLGMMDWAAEMTPYERANPALFVPTGGPFHVLRRGLAMCLLDDGVFHGHFSQTSFGTIAWIDETGIPNTGTTGLSKGWLGRPLDPPQRVAAYTGGNDPIWARRFDNGAVVINWGVDHSGPATSVNLVTDLGWTDTYKTINGAQDSLHNDDATKISLNVKQADAYILQRVP